MSSISHLCEAALHSDVRTNCFAEGLKKRASPLATVLTNIFSRTVFDSEDFYSEEDSTAHALPVYQRLYIEAKNDLVWRIPPARRSFTSPSSFSVTFNPLGEWIDLSSRLPFGCFIRLERKTSKPTNHQRQRKKKAFFLTSACSAKGSLCDNANSEKRHTGIHGAEDAMWEKTESNEPIEHEF